MAKHEADPVLQELVKSINDSGQAMVPVTVSVHGTVVTGWLIAQNTYFTELVNGYPLMSALEPKSGLLGKGYAQDVDTESDHHLHLRATRVAPGADGPKGLWRISLNAVDAWTLRESADAAGQDDRGPFARLLGQ